MEKDNAKEPRNTVYEVEFKGGRRDYYLCPEGISLKSEDYVIVQAERGEHMGRIVHWGSPDLFPQLKEMKNILRHASYTDIQVLMDNKQKEDEAFIICQKKIEQHELNMKLVDVEYQFDGNKICFYFTADKRIDFRELVKDLAAEYRTRIELRQIGVRDEARRLGGLGVCGRSLCCKDFLAQFEPISSQMARDQNLSLSPSKISGLCGRLMCCLAFEEEFYKCQCEHLPSLGSILEKDGKQYEVVKVDIFNDLFVIKDNDGNEKTVTVEGYMEFKKVGAVEPQKVNLGLPKEDVAIEELEDIDDDRENIAYG
jgi:cell fate regulator YaaT (PSP1 superfamily)